MSTTKLPDVPPWRTPDEAVNYIEDAYGVPRNWLLTYAVLLLTDDIEQLQAERDEILDELDD